ncbi:MAG: NADH-quinone oxidoreductase subunit NuoE [Clostridia bacterium]|nr:NADH-quinone oxidoreductase subunit NuoE [Clostridia bacterium]
MCECSSKQNKVDLSLLDGVLSEYAGTEGSLITILQKAQDIYGYLPQEVLWHVAKKTDVKPAKVLGVATFYTQFRFKPVGRYLILLCKGTACHVNGADSIYQAIQDELGIGDGDTTDDLLFSLKVVACLGCCSLSPVMMINDETYGSLTPIKTREILKDIRTKEAAV